MPPSYHITSQAFSCSLPIYLLRLLLCILLFVNLRVFPCSVHSMTTHAPLSCARYQAVTIFTVHFKLEETTNCLGNTNDLDGIVRSESCRHLRVAKAMTTSLLTTSMLQGEETLNVSSALICIVQGRGPIRLGPSSPSPPCFSPLY